MNIGFDFNKQGPIITNTIRTMEVGRGGRRIGEGGGRKL